MNKLAKLYKRTKTGATQTWEVIADGNSFYTCEGQLNGAITESKPTVCEGKNIGKANETSPSEQALAEAQAKWQKKIDKGYTTDINDIDNSMKYFEPMLAHKLVDYKDKITYPVLVSPKIDGARSVKNKKGLWTRNGKPYVSVPHIEKILKPVIDVHPDWKIDGELFTFDVPFEGVMSLIKKSKPTAEDLVESEKFIQYYIFDGVTDDVDKGFLDRFNEIKSEIKKLVGKDFHIVFVENEVANSFEEIEALHNRYIEEGYEGAMVRIGNSPYENKRSKNLLKYKHFEDDEFEILDILEGKGNRANMAGKLNVRLRSGKECECGIKGGETYYKQLWINRKKIIGKKATVRYQGFTDEGKLRFGVAVNIEPFDR